MYSPIQLATVALFALSGVVNALPGATTEASPEGYGKTTTSTKKTTSSTKDTCSKSTGYSTKTGYSTITKVDTITTQVPYTKYTTVSRTRQLRDASSNMTI